MSSVKAVGQVEDMGQFMGEVLTRLDGLDDRMVEQCAATRELRAQIVGRDARCQTRGETIVAGAVRSKLSIWLSGIAIVLILSLAAVVVRLSVAVGQSVIP